MTADPPGDGPRQVARHRRFANVAVPVPTRGRAASAASDTYTYIVPPALHGRVRVGVVVVVPFGRRRVEGIVVELAGSSPVDEAREIEGIAQEGPVLDIEAVSLGRWMARRYAAPLFECLAAMTPPGAWTRRVLRYHRTKRPPDPLALGPQALALLGAYGRRRALDADTLARRSGVRNPAHHLADLVAGGYLEAREEDRSASPRPRREVTARLLVEDAAERERRLRALRSKPAADVLALLRDRAPAPVGVGEALAMAGGSSAALAALEKEGLVARSTPATAEPARPGQAAVAHALEIVARGIRAREAEHRLRGTSLHAAALDYLAAAEGVAPWRDVSRATGAGAPVRADLEKAGLIGLDERRVWRDPVTGRGRRDVAPLPTEDQARAWRALRPMLQPYAPRTAPLPLLREPVPVACVVHGVTGSGKTELFLRSIAHVISQGRRAIVLVPEIALTAQALDRYASRFPGRVGAWHSGLSPGERLDTWQRSRDGQLDLVVGSRSAVFAPLPALGLIVVDEEHAGAYKQDRTPRYDARDVALRRAVLHGATVLLGSATPSVTTYWRSIAGPYRRVELSRRIATGADETRFGPLPPVTVVDMRAELRAGNSGIFSRALQLALQQVLDAGEQAILFLNRRGGATFVSCRDCGHVVACPRCAVPLTYHYAMGAMACHYCNRRELPPVMCPECASPRIRYFGAGTERVEQEVGSRFPNARALRWDSDVTARRGAHEAILARFASGEADILVGTQMIAKGLDLPGVTLVGVVSADTSLHLPDPWARERTFQTLTQVAGRAGRSVRGGRVIFQTYRPDDPAILRAALHDYAGFYADEIAYRAENGYPPFRRLVRLELLTQGSDAAAEKEATRVADGLRSRIEALGLAETDIVGPAPAFFYRVRGKKRWHVVIRSEDPYPLLDATALGPGWRVDVDPVSLL